MCFFSISCLTKSWKLWLDHALIPFEWHLILGLSGGQLSVFNIFEGARFGIQLQVSAIASRYLGRNETNDLFEAPTRFDV